MSYALDDAAAAALFALARTPTEQIGALYADGSGFGRTATVSSGMKGGVRGSLSVPTGALRALFHNHPSSKAGDTERARFSPDDKAQAKRLGVPSYISAGDRIRRYEPGKGETDVLAQFPWDELRRNIMVEILKRSEDDPRGAMR